MTTTDLSGRRVAFLVANDGVEDIELTHPWDAVTAAGGRAVLIAPRRDDVQTYRHLDRSRRFPAELPVAEAVATDYDAVVLPGGVANPDILRQDRDAHRLLRQADARGTTIAAICHAPWTLIDAGLVRGRTLDGVAQSRHRPAQRRSGLDRGTHPHGRAPDHRPERPRRRRVHRPAARPYPATGLICGSAAARRMGRHIRRAARRPVIRRWPAARRPVRPDRR